MLFKQTQLTHGIGGFSVQVEHCTNIKNKQKFQNMLKNNRVVINTRILKKKKKKPYGKLNFKIKQ